MKESDQLNPGLDDEMDPPGEWSCVSNKKAKSKNKKKMKNAKTLSLQTFFSQTPDSENYSSGVIGGGGYGVGIGSPPIQDYSTEELLARESLLTYFSDLVRRLGPLRLDGPQLRLHLEERLSDSESMLTSGQSFELENFPSFLAQSPDLLIVDDYVCSRHDHSVRAKQLALNTVLESFKSISSYSSLNPETDSVTTTGTTTAIGPPPPPPGNAWKTGPPKSTTSNNVLTGLDPLLQLPKVESLFNGRVSSGVPLPDLSSPPPPLPPTLVSSSDPSLNTAESLSKRMQGLSVINSDLMRQLGEKDRQIQSLQTKVQSLERQLELVNLEMAKIHRHSPAGSSEGSGSQDHVVTSLKQQLELERWNSRNLKDQLELEKDYGNRMTEKHNVLLNKLQNLTELSSSSTPATATTTGPGGGSSFSSKISPFDSLGLRGLIANASADNPTISSSLVGGHVSSSSPSSSTSSHTQPSQHNKLFHHNPTFSNSTGADDFLDQENDLFKRLSMRSNDSAFDTKAHGKF